MNIELTVINHSNDQNNSAIVIFSKNVATQFEETSIAWQVIQNLGRNWSHVVHYPMDNFVGCQDAWGNRSDIHFAQPGQRWEVTRTTSGDTISIDNNPASSPNELEIVNNLSEGSIDAQIYKDGKLFSMKTGVAPGQKAVFEFKPTIWIGVVSQMEQGAVMNSAIISNINTEISMMGLVKANIIMTGGGEGSSALPFKFTVEPTF
jgi:hypothetical protein